MSEGVSDKFPHLKEVGNFNWVMKLYETVEGCRHKNQAEGLPRTLRVFLKTPVVSDPILLDALAAYTARLGELCPDAGREAGKLDTPDLLTVNKIKECIGYLAAAAAFVPGTVGYDAIKAAAKDAKDRFGGIDSFS